MRFDLHTHTNASMDGIVPPEKLVEIARKRVDGIAITDHNTMEGWKQVMHIRDFPIIPGMEIKIKENGRTIGDILALFLSEEIQSRSLHEVIDEIKAQDGIISIAHPFRSKKPFLKIDEIKNKIDAIEVFNSRCFSDEENEDALRYAKKHRLAFTAGSDAHTIKEIGRAYTIADAGDLEGLRKAIKKGQTNFEGRRSHPSIHLISPVAKTSKKLRALLPL
ncbi:MAG: CehA/McbA family metallohydrolase [Candidatus Aenigmarchaeota archaeon]|nr:CehA/McbA family metallohydrolase [Candidatus Aenigmarchaeota archaeon]